MVPIIEPELLAEGTHSLGHCAGATALALMTVTRALREAGVSFAATVIKPNMILPGSDSGLDCTPKQVARATVEVLSATMPDELAGVAFCPAGRSPNGPRPTWQRCRTSTPRGR